MFVLVYPFYNSLREDVCMLARWLENYALTFFNKIKFLKFSLVF